MGCDSFVLLFDAHYLFFFISFQLVVVPPEYNVKALLLDPHTATAPLPNSSGLKVSPPRSLGAQAGAHPHPPLLVLRIRGVSKV